MLAGIRPVTQTRDPYVGFASHTRLFVPADGPRDITVVTAGARPTDADEPADPDLLTTAYTKMVWFNEQTFPRFKRPGTQRIFCLGGSTTFGRPYADSTSYVGWLRELLPVADSSTRWEVINVGGVSYASYRLAAVMEELLQYDADVFIVYTAQNEFLERRTYANMFAQSMWWIEAQAAVAGTRTFAMMDRMLGKLGPAQAPADILPAEVDERLNHTIGPSDYQRDPVWKRQVVEHYRLNLQRMVDLARGRGVRVLFITPASNAKDCSPFKSDIDHRLAPEQRQEIELLLERARSAAGADDQESASQLYRQVLRLDPGLADAHYLLGKSLFSRGDYQAAREAFRQAIETDVCPLRAVADLPRHVREVCELNRIPLVDFEQLLEELCQQKLGHACVGAEFFVDHVHPDINTHRQLALWLIESLQQTGWVSGPSLLDPAQQPAIAAVIRRVESSLDQSSQGVALRNLAKVLHWAGKFAEAAPRASDALELLLGDPESRFVLADCLKNMGDREGALRQYELLAEDAPNYARALVPHAELLVEMNLFSRGKPLLLLALLREPDNAYAHYLLGVCHLALQEHTFAVECFERADQLFPNDQSTQAYLTQARQALAAATAASAPTDAPLPES